MATAKYQDAFPLYRQAVVLGRFGGDISRNTLAGNNACENAIWPFVVSRRNWLFADTVGGATASANLYSLIETAKANSIEPYQYLCALFVALPKATRLEDYEALLPWRITVPRQ